MFTRCPNCDTVFRVTPTQIKARAGTVRCGQCHFVFNALDTLEEITPPLDEPIEIPSALPQATHDSAIDTTNEVVPPPSSPEALSLAASDEPTSLESIDEPEPFLDALEALEPPTLADDYLAAPLQTVTETVTKRWPWVVSSVITMLILLVQIAYYYRVEIAATRPTWRPALVSLCGALHCEVPRPRQIDAISIDSSDLRPDAQHPGRLMLSAALRSKSSRAQEWPTLELTLTDVADRRLAVRQFAAVDYLPKDRTRPQLLAAGFPPNGEMPVTLALDIDGLQAAGYRLYVFYP